MRGSGLVSSMGVILFLLAGCDGDPAPAPEAQKEQDPFETLTAIEEAAAAQRQERETTESEDAFATLAEIEAAAVAKREAGKPEYLGIETRLLQGNLVSFLVEMRRAATEADVARYSQCAAAQYALIRGYGFARHVRTNVTESGGIWNADAVYTISSALPQGINTLDAEVTVANCLESGIPTV